MLLNFTILAIVVFLMPMVYLFLASPAFLLVSLDIPQVATLLRTQFYGYFMALLATGVVAASVDALAGHVAQAGVIALVTAAGFIWRRRVMTRMDELLRQKNEGVPGTAAPMRRVHVTTMAVNAVQLAALIALVPYMIVGA